MYKMHPFSVIVDKLQVQCAKCMKNIDLPHFLQVAWIMDEKVRGLGV